MKARRPHLYIINALRRRYGLAKGQRTANPGSNQAATGLAHLAAVLVMFDPALDLGAIPVVRPSRPGASVGAAQRSVSSEPQTDRSEPANWPARSPS
jgi:hypothetical protein